MILIVSDIHFGRADAVTERAKEQDLLSLLETLRPNLDAVVLLGDVFDQYVEYRHLIPKGFVRFQAYLADLADAGQPVHYVVGNHDPWHLDYFKTELGVETTRTSLTMEHAGRTVLLAHGDGLGNGSLSRWIRGAIRHPYSHALFRTLLPADPAHRLTEWTKNRLSSEPTDPQTAADLEKHAAQRLSSGEADIVIYGHSHLAQCQAYGEAVYVNAGRFDVDRTFVLLSGDSIVVRRWNGEDIFVYPFFDAQDDRSTV